MNDINSLATSSQKSKKAKLLWISVAIIVLVVLFTFYFYSEGMKEKRVRWLFNNEQYTKAYDIMISMKENPFSEEIKLEIELGYITETYIHQGNYDKAIQKLKKIPSENVKINELIRETKYLEALSYLEEDPYLALKNLSKDIEYKDSYHKLLSLVESSYKKEQRTLSSDVVLKLIDIIGYSRLEAELNTELNEIIYNLSIEEAHTSVKRAKSMFMLLPLDYSDVENQIKRMELLALMHGFWRKEDSEYTTYTIKGDQITNAFTNTYDLVEMDGDHIYIRDKKNGAYLYMKGDSLIQVVHNGSTVYSTEKYVKMTAQKYFVAKEKPAIGMSASEVKNSTWGEPKSINTTETAYGKSEQWVYYGNRYIYFDDGVVTSISY